MRGLFGENVEWMELDWFEGCRRGEKDVDIVVVEGK